MQTKEMKLSSALLLHLAASGYESFFEQGIELNQENIISYAASCMTAILSSVECRNCSYDKTMH